LSIALGSLARAISRKSRTNTKAIGRAGQSFGTEPPVNQIVIIVPETRFAHQLAYLCALLQDAIATQQKPPKHGANKNSQTIVFPSKLG